MAIRGSRTTVLLAVAGLLSVLAAATPAAARAAGPDVALKVSVNPDPAAAGTPVGVTATVTNDGDAVVPNATILFFSVQFLNPTSTDGCDPIAPGFTVCTLGALAVGASAHRTITFDGLDPGTLEVTIQAGMKDAAGTDLTDPSPDDNHLAISTVVNPRPDLRLTMTTSPEAPLVGDDLTVTAAVANGGSGPAPNTVFRLPLPAGISVGSMPASCTSSAASVTCPLGDMAAGAATSRAITLRGFPEGPHQLLGSVGSDIVDLAAGNDTAQASVEVSPRPVPAARGMRRQPLGWLVSGVPRPGRCLKGRTLRMGARVQRPAVSAMSVYVSGHRVRRLVGARLENAMTLRRLPARGFVLHVTDELVDGSLLVAERRIVACRAKTRARPR